VGAHRRNVFGSKPTLIGELWKRAFWCLVAIDTYMSAYLGRPRATNPADYDLEFPLDCDDEYFFHPDPEQAFKQPVGKPSYMSAWIHFLKLMDIFGLAQRSIFKKPETMASDNAWDENIVLELDAKLNTWADTIPDHLRWDPNIEDPLFFVQSASLYCDYYWVQIQIHRPGILSGGKSNLSYSSLAVCYNAARSISTVFHRLYSRGAAVEQALPSTFVCASFPTF
ncbi:hypothetical protein BT96DRAFT_815267, partial [Gymnopus androsaceus JB14]